MNAISIFVVLTVFAVYDNGESLLGLIAASASLFIALIVILTLIGEKTQEQSANTWGETRDEDWDWK